MNLLHIGREENMERHAARWPFAGQVERASRPMGLTVEEYRSARPQAQVLVVDAMAQVPGGLIAALPRLRLIHSEGVAYDRIDLAAASFARGYDIIGENLRRLAAGEPLQNVVN